jgi:hypothetical protein
MGMPKESTGFDLLSFLFGLFYYGFYPLFSVVFHMACLGAEDG